MSQVSPVSSAGGPRRSELAEARRRVTTPASIGLLLLRVGFGALLILHGLQHALDIDALTATIGTADVPFPISDAVAAWLVAIGEMGLGLLLVAGFLTRVAGGLVAVLMGLVYVSVYVPDGTLFQISQATGVAGENALTVGLVGLVLVFTGPGRLAADAGLRRSRAGSESDRDAAADDAAGGGWSAAAAPAKRSEPTRGNGKRGAATERPLPDDPSAWTDEDFERL